MSVFLHIFTLVLIQPSSATHNDPPPAPPGTTTTTTSTTTTTTLSPIQRRQRVRFDAIKDQAYSEILESHDMTDWVQHLRQSECMDLCKFNMDCYGLTLKVDKLNFNSFFKIYIVKDAAASCQLASEATVRSPLLESDAGSSSYVMVLEVCTLREKCTFSSERVFRKISPQQM